MEHFAFKQQVFPVSYHAAMLNMTLCILFGLIRNSTEKLETDLLISGLFSFVVCKKTKQNKNIGKKNASIRFKRKYVVERG